MTHRGLVVVSEAGAGALSSYAIQWRKGLVLADGSASTDLKAPCREARKGSPPGSPPLAHEGSAV